MENRPPSSRVRGLALLVSGVIDLLLGAALVLAGAGVLPLDLAGLGISRRLAGMLGITLFIAGAAMTAWQVSRPRPPE
jgi:hypothetical protein